MPLVVTAGACATLALALRASTRPVLIGSMEVWGLCAALAIIAGIGATVSYLSEDPDVLEAESPSDVPMLRALGVEPVTVGSPGATPRRSPASGGPRSSGRVRADRPAPPESSPSFGDLALTATAAVQPWDETDA
ncbi:MAG: hypothetical protein L3J91_01890, partial [Thermoplasmata archaeon]|nr:hypothetical protein [Thermoplasmata archaeon]